MSKRLDIKGRYRTVCNQSRRTCKKTPINGIDFVNSPTLTCKIYMKAILKVTIVKSAITAANNSVQQAFFDII